MVAEPQTLNLDVDGTQFRHDPALERRAGVLMGRFPELYPIREAVTQGELRFGFLFNAKPFDVLTERLVCGSIGKSIKASPVWRDLAGYDAIVWVRQHVWDNFDADSQDALVLHLLLHFDATFVRGTWKLSTRDHDFAGFNDVARHFGSALPDIASFVRALQRGDAPADTGEQTTVDPETGEITVSADAQRVAAAAARRMDRKLKASGTSATITAAGKSVHLGEPNDLGCVGSNHVPGCEHFDQAAEDDEG